MWTGLGTKILLPSLFFPHFCFVNVLYSLCSPFYFYQMISQDKSFSYTESNHISVSLRQCARVCRSMCECSNAAVTVHKRRRRRHHKVLNESENLSLIMHRERAQCEHDAHFNGVRSKFNHHFLSCRFICPIND